MAEHHDDNPNSTNLKSKWGYTVALGMGGLLLCSILVWMFLKP
jgi:hypothetical protein